MLVAKRQPEAMIDNIVHREHSAAVVSISIWSSSLTLQDRRGSSLDKIFSCYTDSSLDH